MFVVLQSNPGVHMEVKSFINAKVKVANFLAIELKAVLKIMVLISTRLCCPSGNKIIVLSMAYVSKELIQQTFIDLPGLYSGFCVNPFGKYEFYGIPHRSRQFHLLHISLEVSESSSKVYNDSIPKFAAFNNNSMWSPVMAYL
jgi:hypothetical protein